MKAESAKLKQFSKYYIYACCILLFCSFPLALFIPYGHGYNIYDLVLPSVLVLSFFGVSLLLYSKQLSQSLIFRLAIGVAFIAIISGLVNQSATSFYMHSAGFAIIPLALSFALSKQTSTKQSQLFPIAIAILWLINLIHAYSPGDKINQMGLSGNKNWFSALVLATLLYAIFYLQKLLSKKLSTTQSWYTAIVIGIGGSILPVRAADSRASLVALLLLMAYIPFLRLKKKGRFVIVAAGVLITVGLAFTFKEKLAWENTRNVRVSIWTSTFDMILDNALLGVGPGNFEAEFPIYENIDHKEMLVAAHTTRHPHNEFLYICSESGLIAGLFWLILVGITLCLRPQNPLDWCASISLFILFIQGMMDKPLFQYPTMLLFYLLIAQIWYSHKALSWTETKQKSLAPILKYSSVAIALIGLFLSFKETSASYYNRNSLRAASKGNYQRAYELCMESTKLASWHLMPQYKAFIFAVKNLQNPQLAQIPDAYLLKSAPYFRNYQLVRADYLQQLARQNPKNSLHFLTASLEAYNNACNQHTSDVLSYTDRLSFCIQYRPINEVIEAQNAITDLYHRKFLRYLNYSRTTDHSIFTNNWLAQKTYGERLKQTNYIMSFMKYFDSTSIAFPSQRKDFIPAFGGNFNIGDMFFASEAYSITTHFDTSKPLPEIYEQLNSNIKTLPNDSFMWPKEILKTKQGTMLSKLCLFSMLARFQGIESAIFKHQGNYYAILYNATKLWLVDDQKVKPIKAIEIKQRFTSLNAEYFAYPQAYFLKNEFFSRLMSEDKTFPHYSTNPAYAIRLFQNHFRSKQHTLRPMLAPFDALLKGSGKK